MKAQEELKATIIEACIKGNMTVKTAAKRLGYTERYVKALKKKYREQGRTAMIHGNCGRQPEHTISPEIRQEILRIRKLPEFSTVNTSHFLEILDEIYSIHVSYSFLYKFLKSEGIKSSRHHRKPKSHKRRKRKEREGELLQADATTYQFFDGDNDYYTIHGFIDDATGKITGLYMCKNECMEGYFQVTRQTLLNYGVPTAIYADGSSIFFSNKKEQLSIEEQLAGVYKNDTQYGSIMSQLGIDLIRAYSSQAKGRIERLWNTLQDRLVTEFKLHKIDSIDKANFFFRDFITRFNNRFAVPVSNSDFLALPQSVDLDMLLSVKYTRTVDNGGCFSLNNTIFKVNSPDVRPKSKISVHISKKIGIVAALYGNTYSVTPILSGNKSYTDSSDSVNMIIQHFIFDYCLKNERIA